MDSLATTPSTPLDWPHRVPAWAFSRERETGDHGEVDAAFAAGIALKTLDDLVRSQPAWAGCWRSRQALKCATAAVRLAGRTEDEHALRDALLLTAAGDDSGPAGKVLLAFKGVSAKRPGFSSKHVGELAELFDLAWDEPLIAAVSHVDDALQSGRPAPFAAAELVAAICASRPDGLWCMNKNSTISAYSVAIETNLIGPSCRINITPVAAITSAR